MSQNWSHTRNDIVTSPGPAHGNSQGVGESEADGVESRHFDTKNSAVRDIGLHETSINKTL